MSHPLNAVLVRLSVSQFSNSREDDSITAEVKALHKLGGKAGKWVKIKLPEGAIEGTRAAVGKARTEHYRLTLPWIEGYRLLPMAARPSYEASMAKHAGAFDAAVSAFVADYPTHIEAARKMHNGTFNQDDYPPAEIVRTHFGYTVEYCPVPAASHFAESIVGPALSSMRQQLEAANQRRVQEAIADVWTRLLDPVRKMADKLADKDPIFRDTLIGNVTDILALVPVLNIVGDRSLKDAADLIQRTLGSVDADTLRENKVLRRIAAEGAEEILHRFGRHARKFNN